MQFGENPGIGHAESIFSLKKLSKLEESAIKML